jgi:hypothetical protein
MALDDHARIDAVLGSHAKSWSLRAYSHELAARRAKAAKERDLARHVNAPPEAVARMTAMHDEIIAGHEAEAAKHHERSAYAEAGWLRQGPEELVDAAYRRENSALIQLAERTSRIAHGDEVAALEAELGADAAALEVAAARINDSPATWAHGSMEASPGRDYERL